jgi:hypothetical protein
LVALSAFLIFSGLLPWLAGFLDATALPKVSAFERLATQPEGAGICESRIVLWRHVWELSWQRPWLGWGMGELDYAHAMQAVSGERFCGQLGHAHNLPLHLAIEWGWPLATLSCLGCLVWLRRHTPWKASQPIQRLGWSWLFVIGFHSLLEFPLWYGPFQMVCGFALGAVAYNAHLLPHRWPRPREQVTSLLTGAWLLCTLWASWDYHRVSQVFLPASERSNVCQRAPANCLDEVDWFHQARDYAVLQRVKDNVPSERDRELAQRVAHFAPEPWVLSLLRTRETLAPDSTSQHQ